MKVGLAALVMAAASAAFAAPKGKQAARERMKVLDVVATGEARFVVILSTEAKPTRFLPIWVGPVEALAIRMRLDRQKPPRPLTLNLLESIMNTGRIDVVDISIDDLKGGVFLGKLRLRQGRRRWEIDARPSDAIGLAVGAGVPIFVSKRVVEGAAFDPRDLEGVAADPDKLEERAPERSNEETL